MSEAKTAFENQLEDDITGFFADPLGFVRYVFPWGTGPLEGQSGPDVWQTEFLITLGKLVKQNIIATEAAALKMAVCSGHGVGKTCITAWIILWFMSTRPNLQAIVTANTQAQLNGKTWRELSKWHKLAINSHWFTWQATAFFHNSAPELWRASATPWSKENSQSFAGTHEKDVLVIFDEASTIDDAIWEVTEGAMTTPGAIWLAFGNPTRNTGRFYDCFGKFAHRWKTYKVDSRKAKAANQAQIAQWIEDYGEDSDFSRIRIRGEFPRQGATQFIGSDLVQESKKRRIEQRTYGFQRPIIGVDVARFGSDQSIILVRQGNYIHPIQKYRGIDTMMTAGKVLETFNRFGNNSIVCVDGIGVGAGVVDRLRQLGIPCVDVQSAAKSLDLRTYANKRSELYGRLRDWLTTGGALPEFDQELSDQLAALSYSLNNKLQIQLESKEDIRKDTGQSPDTSDALAYTFAYDEVAMFHRMTKVKQLRPVIWQ